MYPHTVQKEKNDSQVLIPIKYKQPQITFILFKIEF
jgi:hypothetical protein